MVSFDPPFSSMPPNGLLCTECMSPQRLTPGGPACVNGHGGVDGVPPAGKPETIDELEIRETRVVLPFAPANPGEPTDLEPGFQRILEKVFIDDVLSTYEHLELELRLGAQDWADYAKLMSALDRAESNARLAHRLFTSAKCERERWELENQVVHASMREEALYDLNKEKKEGTRAKQITDADVVARCSSMFQEQWVAQQVRREKVKAMEDSLANLAELCASRCRSLQAMVMKQRT